MAWDRESRPRKHTERRDHLARILAYVCYQVWIGLLFFNSVLFVVAGALPTSAATIAAIAGTTFAGASSELFYRISIVCLTVCLIACGVLHRQVMRLWEHRLGRWLGAIVSAVGVCFLAPSLVSGTSPSLLAIAMSGVLTGAGSCLVVLQLGRAFARAGLRASTIDILLSPLVVLPCSAICTTLPAWPTLVLAIVLPVLSVVCLRSIDETRPPVREPNRDEGLRIRTRTLVRFALCACMLGMTVEVSRALYMSASTGRFAEDFQMGSTVIVVVASLALLLAGLPKRTWPLAWFYRIGVILMVAGFAALFVAPESSGPSLSYAIVNSGYVLFEGLVWIVLAVIANRYQYTSVQVFGYGRALVMLSMGAVAGIVAPRVIAGGADDPSAVALVGAAAIVGVVVSYALFLTDTEVTMFQVLPSFDEGDGSTAGALVRNGGLPMTAGESGSLLTDKPKKIPLAKRCAIIGEAYGLTPREIDVFRLLAAGRNSARIQEELAISAGTVNTHTRHIFQKFGVHSQQELIDVFQAANLDEMQERIEQQKLKERIN